MEIIIIEEGSVACLVLGTESSSVYILDPEAFTILDSLDIQSPPVFITASGNQVSNQYKKYMVHFLPIKPLKDGTRSL